MGWETLGFWCCLLAPDHRLDLLSTPFFCHICNCVSLSRCFSAPANGGALHKMAVIVSERSEAAGELQPTLFSDRLQSQTSARRPNEKAICAKRANPIIALVSIKKHVSLLLIHPEQCSHCLMEAFFPMIPINVQQITISGLKGDLCLHSFHSITFHPAHGPHGRRGLLITVRYAAATCVFIYPSKQKKHLCTASLPRSQPCALVSMPALLRGTQMVSTCVLLRKGQKQLPAPSPGLLGRFSGWE